MYSCNCNYDNSFENNKSKMYIDPYGWDKICYPNENLYPQPEEKYAWSWPTCFLKKDGDNFYTLSNKPLNFPIKEADLAFNFEKEFDYILNISKHIRTKQIEVAKYWSYGPPIKQFIPIADILITTYKVTACRAQRIQYILNGALNDACAICWHYKYKYNVIRPVQYNPLFKTIVNTPRHPSYPAGHSVLAGCMAAILSYFFPCEEEKIYNLALECSVSRLYAGVHYKADCDEGFKLGEFIGNSVIEMTNLDINNNHAQIDYQYSDFKDAKIIPDTSRQYIK